MATVNEVLKRLEEYSMQVNSQKSFREQREVDYLGYRITWEGIRPQSNNVQGILDMDRPKTQKQVREFIGMVNYCKNFWSRRSKIMAALTALTGKNIFFLGKAVTRRLSRL